MQSVASMKNISLPVLVNILALRETLAAVAFLIGLVRFFDGCALLAVNQLETARNQAGIWLKHAHTARGIYVQHTHSWPYIRIAGCCCSFNS